MVFENLEYLNRQELWKGTGDYSRDSICRVMKRLGDPQDAVRTALVAGTNGKGSVSAMLASILSRAGLKTGLMCSPHLSRVNERFVVDGRCTSDEDLDFLLGEVIRASKELKEDLSYFELVAGASFLGLRELGCDFGVIEVGLGGKRDATNIIREPEVSSLVSVSFDHQNILGSTIREIAADKAHVARKGRDFIVGAISKEAEEAAREVVQRIGGLYRCYGEEFVAVPSGTKSTRCTYKSSSENVSFSPILAGQHQVTNTAVAFAMASSLQIGSQYWQSGISTLSLPARLEQRRYRDLREVIIDSAHNPAGMNSLCDHLLSSGLSGITIGLGLLGGANWKAMVDEIRPVVSKWCVLKPPTERALDLLELEDYLSSIGVSFQSYGSDFDRFVDEQVSVSSREPVVIAGSIYLVGKLRSILFGNVETLYSTAERVGN